MILFENAGIFTLRGRRGGLLEPPGAASVS